MLHFSLIPDRDIVDVWLKTSDRESFLMARRLIRLFQVHLDELTSVNIKVNIFLQFVQIIYTMIFRYFPFIFVCIPEKKVCCVVVAAGQ